MRLPASFAVLVIILTVIAACGGSRSKTPSLAGPTGPPGPAAAGTPVAGGYAAQPALSQLRFGIAIGLYPIPGDDGFAYLLTKDGKVRRVSTTDDGATHDTVLDMGSRLIDKHFLV